MNEILRTLNTFSMMRTTLDVKIFQIVYVCEQLAKLPELRWGYHAIGFSQVSGDREWIIRRFQ